MENRNPWFLYWIATRESVQDVMCQMRGNMVEGERAGLGGGKVDIVGGGSKGGRKRAVQS